MGVTVNAFCLGQVTEETADWKPEICPNEGPSLPLKSRKISSLRRGDMPDASGLLWMVTSSQHSAFGESGPQQPLASVLGKSGLS